jgi:hypothetical protein
VGKRALSTFVINPLVHIYQKVLEKIALEIVANVSRVNRRMEVDTLLASFWGLKVFSNYMRIMETLKSPPPLPLPHCFLSFI